MNFFQVLSIHATAIPVFSHPLLILLSKSFWWTIQKPLVFIHSCCVYSKERQGFWEWLLPREEPPAKEMSLIWHNHVWTSESRNRNWRFCNLVISYLNYCVKSTEESWQLKIGTLYLIIKEKRMQLSNEDSWYDMWTPIQKNILIKTLFQVTHAASGSRKKLRAFAVRFFA